MHCSKPRARKTAHLLSLHGTQYSPSLQQLMRKFGIKRKSFHRLKITNSPRYCKYHDDGGHDTNFCIALKDMIQSLINDGKLTQYKLRQ